MFTTTSRLTTTRYNCTALDFHHKHYTEYIFLCIHITYHIIYRQSSIQRNIFRNRGHTFVSIQRSWCFHTTNNKPFISWLDRTSSNLCRETNKILWKKSKKYISIKKPINIQYLYTKYIRNKCFYKYVGNTNTKFVFIVQVKS